MQLVQRMARKQANALALLRDLFYSERYFLRKTILLSSFSGLLSLSVPVGVQLLLTFVTAQEIRPGMFAILAITLFLVWLNGYLQIALMKAGEAAEERLFFHFSVEYLNRILNKAQASNERNFAKYFIEISSLQKGFTKVLFDLLFSSLQLIFGILLVSFYHPFFAAFGIFLVISLFLTLRWKFNDALETNYHESSEKYNMVDWLSVGEIFRKKLNRPNQEFANQATDRILNRYLKAKRMHFKLIIRKQHVFLFFKILIIGGMLVLGTILAIQQKISIGQFLAAEIIIVLVANSIEKILFSLESIFDTLTSIEKISKYMHTETSPVNEHTKLVLSSGIHSIAVESEQPLRIQKGEKILLQGSFKACQRLLRELDYRGDYSLKVTINETPIVQLDEASTKSRFGWIDHLPHILSDTFYENIKYNTQADTLNIFEAAKACGLEVLFQNEQELIYSTTHHREEIWTLENRARLECARALVLNPEVLIIRNEFVLRSEDLIQMLIEKLPNTTLIAFSNNQLTIPQFKSIQLS